MHTVTSGLPDGTVGKPSGVFDSGFLAESATWSYTFNEVGEFDYYCTPHPWLNGKVGLLVPHAATSGSEW
jgi:plastocyanin